MEDKSFKQLKELLEGKTIKSVLPPDASEAICKFVLTNGKSFRLHATDLGFWIEGSTGGDDRYESLEDLLRDYSHHEHDYLLVYGYDPPNCIITCDEKTVIFKSPKEKSFKMNYSNLNSEEKECFKSDRGLKRLKFSANMGCLVPNEIVNDIDDK